MRSAQHTGNVLRNYSPFSATQVTLYHTLVRPHACSASYSCATLNNSLLPELLLLSRTMPIGLVYHIQVINPVYSVFFQFILERLRSFWNLGRIISVLDRHGVLVPTFVQVQTSRYLRLL